MGYRLLGSLVAPRHAALSNYVTPAQYILPAVEKNDYSQTI